MEQSELREFEAQCLQEEPPACQTSCPLHVDARGFARLMAEGKIADARKLLDRTLPLSCLLGYLCEGACMGACRRSEIDGSVNLPMLERACVAASRSLKPMPLPASGKHVAVIGGGLSSLAAAWELGKKGHAVTLFHASPLANSLGNSLGGRLRQISEARLPSHALTTALEQLAAVRVTFQNMGPDTEAKTTWFTAAWLTDTLEKFQAVYLGQDDPYVALVSPQLAPHYGDFATNPTSLQTMQKQLFSGGNIRGTTPQALQEAADGKRAALSIDRLLQGVSPTTAREKEDPYSSRLYTDISNISPVPPVTPKVPFAPTQEEAQQEAARCIQCECLECVKKCVYLRHYKGYPKKYAREIYNNLSVIHGLRQANTMINSCAQCGLCATVCPQQADMGKFCSRAQQEMVVASRMPPSAHEFALEDMAFSNAPDVAFFRHQPKYTQSAVAFFPGCQLPASLPEQTNAVYTHLQHHITGGVGLFFGCCGAPARWANRQKMTATTVENLLQAWKNAGSPQLILACASCLTFFTAEVPQIPVASLWDVLAEHPLPTTAQKLPFVPALHDPCATRHESLTQQNVRSILQQLEQPVEEFTLGQEYTRCCGYGGLAAAANPAMGDAYILDRANDTEATILAYCSMCRDRLRHLGKASMHLLQVLFPSESVKQALQRPAPGISDRQENRLAWKNHLLKTVWKEASPPLMQNYTLTLAPEVAQRLEARRILRSDIFAVLHYAEEKGSLFFQPGTGRTLASLRPRQVTFWVEFTKENDGSYTIHDAYCHRMVVPGVPGQGEAGPCAMEGCALKGGRM